MRFYMKLQFMLGTKQFPSNGNNNKDFGLPKKTVNENLCWMRDRKCCVRDKSISIAFCNCVQFAQKVREAPYRWLWVPQQQTHQQQ